MKFTLSALLALLSFGSDQNLHAQAFPSKPGRILVGVSAGGGVDVASRVVAAKLSEYWGHQVVVDNRVGAGQIIASEIVAKAAPDGYTLLSCNIGTHGAGPALFKKLPYDHIKDFDHPDGHESRGARGQPRRAGKIGQGIHRPHQC
jgi:tripartite-type tricarboxylate transporter receptor subunit TctC